MVSFRTILNDSNMLAWLVTGRSSIPFRPWLQQILPKSLDSEAYKVDCLAGTLKLCYLKLV
jgi:hypothetical protein